MYGIHLYICTSDSVWCMYGSVCVSGVSSLCMSGECGVYGVCVCTCVLCLVWCVLYISIVWYMYVLMCIVYGVYFCAYVIYVLYVEHVSECLCVGSVCVVWH